MHRNIGGKIKTFANVIMWIGIIASVVIGIAVMYGGTRMINSYSNGYYHSGGSGQAILAGIVIIVIGILISWIGSFSLYGYGELIESTQEIRERVASLEQRSRVDEAPVAVVDIKEESPPQ
ncbi:hypothetical protein LJC74_08765 [Eubacteriales bacterium OttesenSCG-928-A19]|nr:hypothetical protein [Eubacteriales bacterium OttesenSCG-928-A19]